MGTRQKKLLALGITAALWAGLMLWQWFTWEEPVRVPLTNVSGPAPSAKHAGSESLHVQLDLLAAARTQREMVFAPPRNIFALPSAVAANESGPSEVADKSVQQQDVATDLAEFHYLGFVRTGEPWQKKKQDLAVLTKNDDVHVVKAGETIDKHIVVKAITQESVTLLDRASRLEYTVLLSEEPEAPAP